MLVSVRTELLALMRVKVTPVFALQASKERTVMKTLLIAKRIHVRLLRHALICQAGSTVNVHSILLVMIAEKVRFIFHKSTFLL